MDIKVGETIGLVTFKAWDETNYTVYCEKCGRTTEQYYRPTHAAVISCERKGEILTCRQCWLDERAEVRAKAKQEKKKQTVPNKDYLIQMNDKLDTLIKLMQDIDEVLRDHIEEG